MAHVIHFLDGPEAGTTRRVSDAPGREWREAVLPPYVNAARNPPPPEQIRTNVITYALIKLPDGWPANYWRDTEYVAKVQS